MLFLWLYLKYLVSNVNKYLLLVRKKKQLGCIIVNLGVFVPGLGKLYYLDNLFKFRVFLCIYFGEL